MMSLLWETSMIVAAPFAGIALAQMAAPPWIIVAPVDSSRSSQ
jgi:hypothetical protein